MKKTGRLKSVDISLLGFAVHVAYGRIRLDELSIRAFLVMFGRKTRDTLKVARKRPHNKTKK